jgi:hypothetical protein
MPAHNNFRHQVYTADPPEFAPVYLAAPPPLDDAEEVQRRMRAVGETYRSAGVRVVYLVHGTFTGTDALDLARWIGHVLPSVALWARRNQKALVDVLLGDAANFTAAYAEELERSLAGEGPVIPVRVFHWSSQNHHVGRSDAALRLIDELASQDLAGGRALLWGHSHAGNVFALITNILGADEEARQKFFHAVRPYYASRGPGGDLLQRIEAVFQADSRPLRDVALDLVTLGTPIRYGWDSSGYAKLLHFVYHRPCCPRGEHLAAFPFGAEDLLAAAGGDYIQQIGIAGTNFAPHPLAWRTWRAEVNLNRLLQPDLRRRDLAMRLALGMRIPHEGQTLLVDYGDQGTNLARHIAGHAVYTLRDQMLFHAEEIARRFYGHAWDGLERPPYGFLT